MKSTKGYGSRPGKLNPAQAPSERVTLRDIAWAAGYFEGEGAISGNITASISQKELETLTRLQSQFGGQVSRYRNGKEKVDDDIRSCRLCQTYGAG